MEQNKAFYTVEETAKLLSVTKPLIFKLINSGKLPAADLGSGQRKIYRIRSIDIYNLKTNQKENGNTGHSKNTKTD